MSQFVATDHIRSCKEDSQGTVVQFVTHGERLLSAGSADYDYYAGVIRGSSGQEWPVGFQFNSEGMIERLGMGRPFTVLELDPPSNDMGDVLVYFGGENKRIALRHDHPDYRRLSDVIRAAHANREPVWYSFDLSYSIIDVRGLC